MGVEEEDSPPEAVGDSEVDEDEVKGTRQSVRSSIARSRTFSYLCISCFNSFLGCLPCRVRVRCDDASFFKLPLAQERSNGSSLDVLLHSNLERSWLPFLLQ